MVCVCLAGWLDVGKWRRMALKHIIRCQKQAFTRLFVRSSINYIGHGKLQQFSLYNRLELIKRNLIHSFVVAQR